MRPPPGQITQKGRKVKNGSEELAKRPLLRKKSSQAGEAFLPRNRSDVLQLFSCAGSVERQQCNRRREEPLRLVCTGLGICRHKLAPSVHPRWVKSMATDKPGSAGSSSSLPLGNFITALASERPSPDPGWERLFSSRTKRSVALSRSAASGMPCPLSVTISRTRPAPCSSETRTFGTEDESTEYLMALSIMLESACPISSRLPLTTTDPMSSTSNPTPASSATGS